VKQKTKAQPPKPVQRYPGLVDEVNKTKQKAEQTEVSSRHKNDGQKDHKGAR
jgi:hypothetical protein